MAAAPTPPAGPAPAAIIGVYLALAGLFAWIQPPLALPDEGAHLQYVRFLATEHRLPRWDPGAPEAGYESQHPPLAYLLHVPAAALGGGVYLLRAMAILVGLAWILLALRLTRAVAGDGAPARWATAGLAWLPLTLLYGCHPNPDLVVGLAATGVLGLAWSHLRHGPNARRAAALGACAGAALLTKLSGAAVLAPIAAALLLGARRGHDRAGLRRDALIAAGMCALVAGPWFVRNQLRYGQPVLKAPVHYGSALDNALAGRIGFGQLAAMTAGRTYLSSWCQPDWLPGWRGADNPPRGIPVAPIVAFYSLLSGLLLAGLAGLRRGIDPAVGDFLALGGWLLAAVLVGQQLAFWTQDVEFNMGGRYVLAAMVPIQTAITSGLARLHPRLPAVWLGLLLVMNAVAAVTIVTVLNPWYQPGWSLPLP